MDAHVPGVFDDQQQVSEQVTMRQVTGLNLCAKWLNHSADLQALVRLVDIADDIPKGMRLSARQEMWAAALCTTLGERPETFTLVPLNSVALLAHWRVMVIILSLLEKCCAEDLRATFPQVERQDVPDGWDSHFHLDRLAERTGLAVDDFLGQAKLASPT